MNHFVRMNTNMEEEKKEIMVKRSESSTSLNSFLTDLVNMQDKKLVNESDLDSLIAKYDLQSEDHEKLNMLIERHLSRAFEYKKAERWDNAIVETERALLFSPLDNEIRLDLAELFLNRSVQYGYLQKDLRRADHEVRDALTLEPENSAAKKFKKELNQLNSMLQGKQNNKKLIPLVLLLIIVLAAAMYPQIKKRFRFMSLPEDDALSTVLSSPPPWESRSIILEESDALRNEFNISFTEAKIIRRSNAGIPAVSIAGYLEPLKGDLAQLELDVSSSNLQNSLANIEIVGPGDAPLRQGDTDRFQSFIYLNADPEDMDTLYISIKNRKALYDEIRPQWNKEDFFMENPLAQGIFLEIESLFINQIEGYDRNYLFYDIRVNNKSREALGQLDLVYHWQDDKDKIVSQVSQSLVNQNLLPMKAQSAETYRIMFDLPKGATTTSGTLVVHLEKAEKDSQNED